MMGPQQYDPNQAVVKVGGEVMGTTKPLEATIKKGRNEQSSGGEMPKALSKKQQEKEQKRIDNYWNAMITRRQAYQMVQEVTANQGQMSQQLQLLMIQNRTLLEMLSKKGIATEEEINEHSKEVMESIFGPMPEELMGADAESEVATGDANAD